MYRVEGVCGAFGELLYVKHDAVDRRFGGLTPRQPQPRNVSLKNYNAQTQTRPGLTNRMPAAHLKPYQPHAA